ncbi:mucin-20 [Tenrec ecaudatus]|uniref:mucin-20 n=1 Tax=Tenrec ecaudatus TaxID=94439 RepID=UPI003F59CAB5
MVVTSPTETSATGGSSAVMEMTTAEAVRESGHKGAIVDVLCTDASSEEVNVISIDVPTLAGTSAETEALTLESSPSSDLALGTITIPLAREPAITAPAQAWVSYTIADIEVTNCSVIEIEATAMIPGLSHTDRSPTKGVEGPSTLEIPALPDSTEAHSHIAETTTSVKTLPTAGTTEAGIPGRPVPTSPTNNSTERKTAAKASASHGTLLTVSTHSSEDTAVFSVETTSHTAASESMTVSAGTASAMGKGTTLATASASVHSPVEIATIKNSTPVETFGTGSTTRRPLPTSRDPLPSANSSRGANLALAKPSTPPETLKTSRTTRREPLPAAWARLTTKAPTGGDGGFLLLRLSVVSPEDLTGPRGVARLMKQYDI